MVLASQLDDKAGMTRKVCSLVSAHGPAGYADWIEKVAVENRVRLQA